MLFGLVFNVSNHLDYPLRHVQCRQGKLLYHQKAEPNDFDLAHKLSSSFTVMGCACFGVVPSPCMGTKAFHFSIVRTSKVREFLILEKVNIRLQFSHIPKIIRWSSECLADIATILMPSLAGQTLAREGKNVW